MQIVIDIPEDLYKRLFMSNDIWDMRMAGFVCSAIKNGTILPKHGRLKDFDRIEWYGCTSEEECPHKDRECKDCDRANCWKPQVDKLPTILEATKESEE